MEQEAAVGFHLSRDDRTTDWVPLGFTQRTVEVLGSGTFAGSNCMPSRIRWWGTGANPRMLVHTKSANPIRHVQPFWIGRTGQKK